MERLCTIKNYSCYSSDFCKGLSVLKATKISYSLKDLTIRRIILILSDFKSTRQTIE